jgi:hypothetical protein
MNNLTKHKQAIHKEPMQGMWLPVIFKVVSHWTFLLSYLYCTKKTLMIYTLYKVIKWPPNIVIVHKGLENPFPRLAGKKYSGLRWGDQASSLLGEVRPGVAPMLNYVKLMTGETWWLKFKMGHILDQKEKGRNFWESLDQLRGWPPGWLSWSSKQNEVKLMTLVRKDVMKKIGPSEVHAGMRP